MYPNVKKGVICKILPDYMMPIDREGNRADVITYAKGAVARLNPGQFYECYINAASRDLTKWIIKNYKSNKDLKLVWDKLLSYYSVVSQNQYNLVNKNYDNDDLKNKHIQSIIESGIYLYISAVDTNINSTIIERIEKIISPTFGPVRFVDDEDNHVITKDPILIGCKNMIILEKTDQHPMAIGSGTLQHHGLLSGASKANRLAHPSKQQTARVLGETEVRLYAAAMGADVVSELLDLSNNPDNHRETISSIMKAKYPTNIKNIIDRKQYPVGRSRALSFCFHILNCLGFRISE